jgi:hypothetical protein
LGDGEGPVDPSDGPKPSSNSRTIAAIRTANATISGLALAAIFQRIASGSRTVLTIRSPKLVRP